MSNAMRFVARNDLKMEYERKLVSADEAVKIVKSGDHVNVGAFGSVCRDLEAALARRVDELEDVVIYSTLWSLPGSYKTMEADNTGRHFRLYSNHMSKKDRVINKRGQAWYIPPSTKILKDGTRESLIVPFMQPGSIVSCPRAAVMYLVTEYGIEMMKGKSTWERAESIINLAHPDFRDDLIKQAEKQGVWRQSSKLI